jgi:hypothetical protein
MRVQTALGCVATFVVAGFSRPCGPPKGGHYVSLVILEIAHYGFSLDTIVICHENTKTRNETDRTVFVLSCFRGYTGL